jgi:DNA-binding MarR family transcriptional regulator
MATSRKPSNPKKKNSKAEINVALVRAARAHRVAAAQLLSEVGLHPGQEALLMELWQGDGQTQAELAEALAVEPPTITKMLQRMESAGLVQRKPHPDDRRAQLVYLTARGKRLQQKVDRLWGQLATRAVSGLSDRQQATLRSMLGTITENLTA